MATSTGTIIVGSDVGIDADKLNSHSFDVRNFGAVGNGRSNPASTRFQTLAACQAVFGITLSGVPVALSQELDWLGTQRAINVAVASGGVVHSFGSFVYCNANSVADGSGTLTWPVASQYSPGGGVSWKGDFPGSLHSWPFDLGTGRFAALCQGRATNAVGSSVGFFHGLVLIGPGCGGTIGSTTCNMQGIGSGDRRTLEMIYVTGFRVGVNVVGGQCSHTDVYASSNYYGYYFDNPLPGLRGNMLFTRVICDESRMAGLAVHHAANITGCQFTSCFFGAVPFSLLKETNGGAPASPYLLAHAVFDSCQFENVGNAMVGDDTANQASRVAVIMGAKFRNCQFMWDAYGGLNRHLPGTAAFSIFDVNSILSTEIDGIWNPEQIQPGTNGVFHASRTIGGLLIRGDMNAIIANCNKAANSQFIASGAGGKSGIVIEHTGYEAWSGTMALTVAPTPIGAVIVQAPGSSMECCQPANGTPTDAPLGVVMYNPSASGQWVYCIYANKGDGITVNCAGTVSPGQILRTAAFGSAIAASGSNDLTSPLIGIAMSASSGATCQIKLKGLN